MADVQAQLATALPRAYVAAFRWLGNREESRDACQEAAARALAAAERYDPDQPFYPWFYTILRNHCMDLLTRRRAGRAIARQLLPDAPPGTGGAEGVLLTGGRAVAVTRAMEQLPAELREVIELRHFQDLSYAEMAAIIGCPEGTVMSRLYRARRALRDQLGDRLDRRAS